MNDAVGGLWAIYNRKGRPAAKISSSLFRPRCKSVHILKGRLVGQ